MEYKGIIMDDFQVNAVNDLKAGKSVVVAAPTGCGKTLIAEYLLDNFLKEGERAIYTAPIKALSNQKYRDFSKIYKDKVGMLTGDISINNGAQILIMTTEIFRNMLFAEKELLEDVKYIIFDEIHYINDIQRGVIWEESVIFALPQMRFLCLSATIPNASDLADWIQDIKKHEVSLIEKFDRPVPLYHNVFTKKSGLIPSDKFLAENSKESVQKLAKNFNIKGISDLVHVLQKKDLLPSICFVFSREGCFKYGKEVAKEFDFLDKEQKKIVSKHFSDVIKRYDITSIKTVELLRKLAMNGVGVHNAGILPVLKEVIEILFGMGLLKVIFVTETFAVGVNMPARAAVFASLEKYDGIEFRYLKNNEYYQMAGRAGRRGIDEQGYVVSVVESSFLKYDELERIFDDTKLEPLESQFKLSYNTVLNLIDQYEIEQIKDILKMSFAQFLSVSKKNELKEKIDQKQEVLDDTKTKIACSDYEEWKSYSANLRKKHRFTIKLKVLKERLASGNLSRKLYKKLSSEMSKVKQNLNRATKKLSNIKCSDCPEQKKCKNLASKVRDYNKRINELEEHGRAASPDHFQIFLKKYNFLEKTGYIENGELTGRGKIGSRIYGYELMVTELAMEGIFHDYNEDEINVLCACMIYEINPKKDYNTRIDRNNMYNKVKRAKWIVEAIKKEEVRAGLEPSKSIYFDVIAPANAWSNGAEFKDILHLTHLSEGDIIRLFRQVIDLLQQIKRVFMGDDALVHKINRALDKVNRDIVNVSEYLSE
ncbi:MAG: DEAD/DEAH box helicase [Candidatus Muirbacterium halophilum]|nr:DEAD/DEAH box helicase [Candidatus Muirbacterium halophilum]MCK9475050.1 DEAD/DEAH box helicase [Candidatus Muirbacterium halophilum]